VLNAIVFTIMSNFDQYREESEEHSSFERSLVCVVAARQSCHQQEAQK